MSQNRPQNGLHLEELWLIVILETHAPINLKQIRGLWGIGALPGAARQALTAMESVLIAEGHPAADSPILWDNAQAGDLVGSPETGQYRVIDRRLWPKWRLLAYIPDSQLWLDGAQHRAVLAPIHSVEWT